MRQLNQRTDSALFPPCLYRLLSVILAYSIPPSQGATALLQRAVPPASSEVTWKVDSAAASEALAAFAAPKTFELPRVGYAAAR